MSDRYEPLTMNLNHEQTLVTTVGRTIGKRLENRQRLTFQKKKKTQKTSKHIRQSWNEMV